MGRVNHAMAAVDGKLYLLGGRTCQGPEKQKVLSEIHVYDTKVRSWDEVGRLAVPVESAPVVVVDAKVTHCNFFFMRQKTLQPCFVRHNTV